MAVLDGKTIVEKHYVTSSSDTDLLEEQIQPNGLDLRIQSLFHVTGKARLPREGKMDFSAMQLNQITPKNGEFNLHTIQGTYLVDFQETISVPDGFCAIVISRSSMLRTGALMTSALWDTGFSGRLGGALRILNPMVIEYGARLGQVVFLEAKFNGLRYEGRYQGGNSQVGYEY